MFLHGGCHLQTPVYLDLNVSAVISYRYLLEFLLVMSPSKTYRSIVAYFGLAASFFLFDCTL